MALAGIRCAAFIALALGIASDGCAQTANRAAPSRPGLSRPAVAIAAATSGTTRFPKVTLRVGAVEYISASEVASWLQLMGRWTVPQKELTFTSKAEPSRKLVLEANSRNASVDGLRIDLGNPTVLRGERLYIGRIDLEHCLAPLLRPSALGNIPHVPRTIMLDAGHGGWDPGMENKRLGLQEKALTVDVTNRLEKLLREAGYRVVVSRTHDMALAPDKKGDLLMRSQIANRAGADLVISVHFNSLFPDTKTGGTEVYVYTPASQRSSQAWAVGEADDSKPAQPVNRYDAWSALLAHEVHRNVLSRLGTNDRGLKTKHLLAFQDLNCPAALIESVFLSNENEARRAASPEFRQRIAEALAAAIRDYANVIESLHPQTAQNAGNRRSRHTSRSS